MTLPDAAAVALFELLEESCEDLLDLANDPSNPWPVRRSSVRDDPAVGAR